MRSLSHSTMAVCLRGVIGAVCRRPWWFVYPPLLLAAACIAYAAHNLRLDVNRGHLIGPAMESQQVYLAFQKEFPGVENELVVVVQSGQRERNRQFIERLAGRIKPETNTFADLFYKADLTTLGPKALLLASTKDLENMRQALQSTRPLLERFAQATNLNSLFNLVNAQFRKLSLAQTEQSRQLVQAIPFLQIVLTQATQDMLRPGQPPPPELEAFFNGDKQAQSRIYITLDHGRSCLLTVRPRTEALTTRAIVRLRQLISATAAEVPGVNVGLTGGPVLDSDEMRQAEHDTTQASLLAFVLCAALFIIAYRQIWRPLKATVCLLVGLGYTLGFTTLAIGHLNILSITFAPMLIGLAIDFGIHYISRYEEEMRNRRSPGEALERATVFTGQGIVTAGLTTAGAFLAMALTHFKGIREMGLIAGCGLLLCLIPMLSTLPVLLTQGSQNQRDHQIGPAGQRRLQLEFLWLKHPFIVLAVTTLACLGSALQFHHLNFDYDLLHMQSQKLASVRYEKQLIQSAGASSLFGAVIADSMVEAREYEKAISQLPAVAEVRSVVDIMGGDQERKLELVRSIKKELTGIRLAPTDRSRIKVEPLSATLWYLTGYLGAAAEEARKNDPGVAHQLGALEATITRFRVVLLKRQPQIPNQLTKFQQVFFDNLHDTILALQTQDTHGGLRPADLPPALRDRFVGINGKYLLQVYPRKDLWQHANQREFIDQLTSVIPKRKVTGTPLQLYEYTTLLKDSYETAAGYAFIAITLLVVFHFRSLLLTSLALLPVAVGACWLLGFMGLTRTAFNPANIMILPLLLGIGVTNGVQILNRFAEERQPSILAKSTGKAVLVSGLTAIVGFGSLILAGHQGIRSLGLIMSIGIAACMVAALTVLPALLRIILHRDLLRGSPGID